MAAASLSVVMQVTCAAWACCELLLAALPRMRRPQPQVRTVDRKSLVVLLSSIGCGAALATIMRQPHWTPIALRSDSRLMIASACLAAGISLRGIAMLSLGRFFSVHVSISHDHRLVRTGLYRFVRHPSYTGLLVAVCGITFAFGDWLTVMTAVTPVALATIHRLQIEERALQQAFPNEWGSYCQSTWRLVPWLY